MIPSIGPRGPTRRAPNAVEFARDNRTQTSAAVAGRVSDVCGGHRDDRRSPGTGFRRHSPLLDTGLGCRVGGSEDATRHGPHSRAVAGRRLDPRHRHRLSASTGRVLADRHLNMCFGAAPAGSDPNAGLTARELERLKARQVFQAEETGYQQIQGTKPQTLGVALNDSPAGGANGKEIGIEAGVPKLAEASGAVGHALRGAIGAPLPGNPEGLPPPDTASAERSMPGAAGTC